MSSFQEQLEGPMRKISQVISIAGLGLMILGLIDYFANGISISVPGFSVLPLPALLHIREEPLALVAMSVGIVLFALLPTFRVLLALWTYLRQHKWLESLAALIVFLELLFSIRSGG
jgi:hypothetical protein